MGFYLKSPASEIDYAVDWSAGYLDGETVTASAWRIEPEEPDGLVVGVTVTGPQRTAATLMGGCEGHVYRVANDVTLSDGRRDTRTLTIRIEER
ncbi:hypothetical protein KCG44_00275 [Pacificimonas sp. WHA3]|uniref:Phage protein n=1 Tax=Pacificimonas pallii TaxID=2827236 RepID=A0ABS6SAH9_9SPHN|nr:hypothetical protein [Pacificimonas pallii]MBV7255210.1 hypothetical protein [Pacificimonas pallii]